MTFDFAQVVARLSAAAGVGLLVVAVATMPAFGQASSGVSGISSGGNAGASGGPGGISAGAGAGAGASAGPADASGSGNVSGTVSPSGSAGVSASGKASSVSPTPGTRPGSSAAGTRPGASSAGTRPGASSAGTRPGRTGTATRPGGTSGLTRPSASATTGADATSDSDTTTSGSTRTGASGSTGGSSGRLDPNRDIREVLRDNEFYREHGRFPRPGELPPITDSDTDTDPAPTSPRGIVRPGDPTSAARRADRFNQNRNDTTPADTAPDAEDFRSNFGDLEDRFDTRSDTRSRTTTNTDTDLRTDPADASANTTTDTTTDTTTGADPDADSVRDAANQFQDRFRDARETFQDTRDDARDTFRDAREDIRSGTSDDTVRDAARDFQDTTRDARDTLRDTRDVARDAFRDARDDLRDTRVSADFRLDTLRSADIGIWFDRSAEGLVISDLATTGLIASLGFREGDQIISVNGQRVARERDFLELVFADPSLNRVDVVVERFGRQIVVPVNPSTLVREFTTASVQVDPVETFGVVLDDRYPDYVVVWRVMPRSPAFYAGLRPGDVIVNWQGQRITSPTEFTRFLQSSEPGSVNVEVSRNRQVRRFDVDLPSLDVNARANSRTMLRPDFDATIRGDADVRARGADVRVRGDADADAEFTRPRVDNDAQGSVEIDGGARGGILPRIRRN